MIFNPDDSDMSFDLGADFEIGEGDFTVKSANPHTSPAGKESIKVVSNVTDTQGTSKLIDTYLSKNAVFRIKEFCYATCLEEVFKKGELTPDNCAGRTGKCVTHLQKGTEFKNKKGEMQMGNDKIVIKYFIAPDAPVNGDFKEDDINFME